MKATSREEFRRAFRQALDSGRGAVVEVATYSDEYLRSSSKCGKRLVAESGPYPLLLD